MRPSYWCEDAQAGCQGRLGDLDCDVGIIILWFTRLRGDFALWIF